MQLQIIIKIIIKVIIIKEIIIKVIIIINIKQFNNQNIKYKFF